jgi:hypothetical protein
MSDSEVERLRRLRAMALRVRAVARALGKTESMRQNSVCRRTGSAAWRVARTASGRLRAHPHARFQKDAGMGVILWNSLVATTVALSMRGPQAVSTFERLLRQLARELDHARALTWAAELSDTFGRSQLEIRALIDEFTGGRETAVGSAAVAASNPRGDAPFESDWPYLAL